MNEEERQPTGTHLKKKENRIAEMEINYCLTFFYFRFLPLLSIRIYSVAVFFFFSYFSSLFLTEMLLKTDLHYLFYFPFSFSLRYTQHYADVFLNKIVSFQANRFITLKKNQGLGIEVLWIQSLSY